MGATLIPLMGRPANIQTPQELQQGALQNQNMALINQQRQQEIAQQQQAMADQERARQDQQTVMKALETHKNWDGALTAIRGKISPQSQAALEKHVLDQRKELATANKTELDTQMIKGQLIEPLISRYAQMTPEQQAQAWPVYRDLAIRIHPELANQLTDQPLTSEEAHQIGFGLVATQAEIARAKAQQESEAHQYAISQRPVAEATAQANLTRTQQQVEGTTPLTLYEQAKLKAEDSKVLDNELAFMAAKGDEVAKKAIEIKKAQAAAGRTSLNLPGMVGKEGIDLMAETALAGGTVPSRNPVMYGAVMQRAAEMAKERGLTTQAAVLERNAAQANKSALNAVTKQYETLKPFAEMAEKNATILENAIKGVSDLGAPALNFPLRMIQDRFTGNPKVAAFKAAILPVQADFARILNSPTGSGVLSDTARKEMEAAIQPGATVSQMKAALDIFRQDARNRRESYEAQLKDLKAKTVVRGIQGEPAATPASDPLGLFK